MRRASELGGAPAASPLGCLGVVTQVLLVQHGEKVRAPGDPGLTATGEHQAEAVAAWLVASGIKVSAVWTSPMRRARETAMPIAAAYAIEVQTDDRLRERMNWDDDATLSLAQFLSEWEQASGDPDYEPTVGDSSRTAARRFVNALTDIARTAPDGTVVVVGHGGITVDALRSVVGDAAIEATKLQLIAKGDACGAVTTQQVEGDEVSVIAFPSTDHLENTTPHSPT